MKVLVVDGSQGQTHTAVSAVRALAAGGHQVDLAYAGPWNVAARSRFVTRRFEVPGADDAGFAVAVHELLSDGSYDACFPTSDAALAALDWPGAALIDKREMHQRWARVGAPLARSWEFASGPALLADTHVLSFPLAVKAAEKVGDGVPSVWRAAEVSDLTPLRDMSSPVVVEEWLEGEQTALCGVLHEGRLLAAVHQRYLRTWPATAGDACAAVTTEPDLEVEKQVMEALHGYDGLFQTELIDGVVHDVNPRVYGSVSLAVHAGANLPDFAARLAAGHAPSGETVRGRVGVHHRWLEGDLRHVAAAVRSGDLRPREAARVMAPVRGTVHPDLSWSDLRPTLARLRYAARKVTP